jgi:hypothetical protein
MRMLIALALLVAAPQVAHALPNYWTYDADRQAAVARFESGMGEVSVACDAGALQVVLQRREALSGADDETRPVGIRIDASTKDSWDWRHAGNEASLTDPAQVARLLGWMSAGRMLHVRLQRRDGSSTDDAVRLVYSRRAIGQAQEACA